MSASIPPRSTQTLPARVPRLLGIDALRGIAAAAVVVHHLGRSANDGYDGPFSIVLAHLGGWGVLLFFVVSGFCIHAPAAAAGPTSTRLDPAAFYRRRFIRLYPTHLVALLLSILVATLPFSNPHGAPLVSVPTAGQFTLHVFMLHTLSIGAVRSANVVLWTLAVETQFYLLYPLLLAARRRVSWYVLCAGAVLLGQAYRLLVTRLGVPSLENFPVHWWVWMLGAMVAEHTFGRPARTSSWVLFATALVASVVVPTSMGGAAVAVSASHFVEPLLFAVVVLLAARLRVGASLLERSLVAVGKASYSLYLIHPIVFYLVVFVVGASLGASGIVVLGALALVPFTYAFYKFVERPMESLAIRAKRPAPSATLVAPAEVGE